MIDFLLCRYFQRPSYLTTIKDIPVEEMKNLTNFFIVYNEAEVKKFKPLEILGPEQAQKLLNA